MEKGSTFILKATIALIGLVVLVTAIFSLHPVIASEDVGMYRPILVGMYVSMIPFYIALYQALKLLGYIDLNTAFSGISVKALMTIKNCAIAIAAMYALGMPYIYVVADRDDAPGVIVIGLVIIGASLVVATFAAVLQKLLKNAIDIKAENDLTV
jgi:hypothetical protein